MGWINFEVGKHKIFPGLIIPFICLITFTYLILKLYYHESHRS